MADKKAITAIKKEIQKARNEYNKKKNDLSKKEEKLLEMQLLVDEATKEILELDRTITDKETELKRAEYADVLGKLDNAALSSLSVRQTEQLINKIVSGELNFDDNLSENEEIKNEAQTNKTEH